MWQNSRVHLFFVRHGQPIKYGADYSPLSTIGRKQVESSASYFNDRLSVDPGKKRAIYIHSDRLRAEQTAKILAYEARHYVNKRGLDVAITEVASPHSYISTENTLTKFMEDYRCPKEIAASLWLRMPHEQAKSIGVRSSETVANEARLLISELVLAAQNEIGDRQIYYFLGTHETTLMAMLYHMPPHREFKIGYAEFIEIEANTYGRPRLSYKHKGLVINYWENNKGYPKQSKII